MSDIPAFDRLLQLTSPKKIYEIKNSKEFQNGLDLLKIESNKQDAIDTLIKAYIDWGGYKNEDEAFLHWNENRDKIIKLFR